jgi:ABC-type transport system involved in cytochrome bd biosynthesis fused ATPase/permease subunit
VGKSTLATPLAAGRTVRSGSFLLGGLDPAEAEAICRALGLGPLLERMPAGQQPVGETGWQLSHGERSRLYIARALLQGADLVILDESLAALDPETLRQALGCVLAQVGDRPSIDRLT